MQYLGVSSFSTAVFEIGRAITCVVMGPYPDGKTNFYMAVYGFISAGASIYLARTFIDWFTGVDSLAMRQQLTHAFFVMTIAQIICSCWLIFGAQIILG